MLARWKVGRTHTLWALMSLIALTSCASLQGTTTLVFSNPVVPPTPNLAWSLGWLRGEPCLPPCWANITPGVTTATEAADILRNASFVTQLEVDDESILGIDSGAIWWEGPGNSLISGRLDFTLSSPTISTIKVLYERGLDLETIFEAYGEPSHVSAFMSYFGPEGGPLQYSSALVYLQQGFAVTSSSGIMPKLVTDRSFNLLTFFEPGAWPTPLTAWDGVQSFGYYCQDEANGELCQAAFPETDPSN